MSKKEQTVSAPETTAPAEKPKVLSMKSGVSYRGARAAWYERLVSLEGKTKDEVLKNLEAKRPSTYGAKSKFAGQPEPVPGWVRFFERTGVATWK